MIVLIRISGGSMPKGRMTKRKQRRQQAEEQSIRLHYIQESINERIGYIGPLAGLYTKPNLITRRVGSQ